MSSQGDANTEVRKRTATCMSVLKRLDLFWGHSDCSIRQKLLVYNAAVRSKLMYGLESLELVSSLQQKLDVSQMKGYRKILRLQTTYVNRDNKNEFVFEKADRLSGMRNVKLSKYYLDSKLRLFANLVLEDPQDPKVVVTFKPNTVSPYDYGKRRVGRPRQNWIHTTTDMFWKEVVQKRNAGFKFVTLNPERCTHVEAIRTTAKQYLHDLTYRETNPYQYENRYHACYHSSRIEPAPFYQWQA